MAEPRRYRKKRGVIEAMQYDRTNRLDVLDWIENSDAAVDGTVPEPVISYVADLGRGIFRVHLRHKGGLLVEPGDWVIKEWGEFLSVKPDTFEIVYMPVDDPEGQNDGD